MPPKGSSTKLAPPRLPPLPKLRVRRANKPEANPCVVVMSSLLNCWASSGFSVEGCARLEEQLRTCMDEPRPKAQKKNTINYHLSRLYPMMSGPQKKK